MITVVVNFPIPEGMSLNDFKSRMMGSVARYQAMPGLLRKNYMYRRETSRRRRRIHVRDKSTGGIMLFC